MDNMDPQLEKLASVAIQGEIAGVASSMIEHGLLHVPSQEVFDRIVKVASAECMGYPEYDVPFAMQKIADAVFIVNEDGDITELGEEGMSDAESSSHGDAAEQAVQAAVKANAAASEATSAAAEAVKEASDGDLSFDLFTRAYSSPEEYMGVAFAYNQAGMIDNNTFNKIASAYQNNTLRYFQKGAEDPILTPGTGATAEKLPQEFPEDNTDVQPTANPAKGATGTGSVDEADQESEVEKQAMVALDFINSL